MRISDWSSDVCSSDLAEVSGRPKHIFSIWKKMQKKDVPIGELYDLRAVRVMVDDVAACYAALGVVHALWAPLPSEFDDYIARPKRNDYRSLHTAVVGRSDERRSGTEWVHPCRSRGSHGRVTKKESKK